MLSEKSGPEPEVPPSAKIPRSQANGSAAKPANGSAPSATPVVEEAAGASVAAAPALAQPVENGSNGSTEIVATSGDSNSYTPLAIKRGGAGTGLKFPRRMTRAGADPFDSIEWEHRTASITGEDGKAVFTQEGCEIPKPWSQLATNVVVSKYFRGPLDSPRRETSVRQVIGRVAGTLHQWGREGNYFASDEDALAFHDELAFLLLHQYGSFNSPVWFNIGVQGARAQASACFINSVHDNMESIMELASTEARLFKGGSGAGTNLWRVRSSKEQLSGGGIASGPVSFMRGWDAFAGAIKSGGTCLAPYQMVYTEAGPVAVEELAKREGFIALSYDPPAGRMKAKRAQAWIAGRKRVVRVKTDKGAFDLSFDHPVKLSSGEFVRAGELKPGHSLFACSIGLVQGHLEIGLRDGRRGKELLQRLIARDVMGLDIEGRILLHRDGNRFNNAPDNLQVTTQSDLAREQSRAKTERGQHIFQRERFDRAGAANGMHTDSEFWSTERADTYRETQRQVLVESGRAGEMQKEAARQKSLNTAFRILNGGWPIDTFEQYVQGRKLVVGRIPSISVLRHNLDEEFGSYDGFVRQVARANHRVLEVTNVGEMDVYDVEVECPTPDDKSPQTGHNFVLWNGSEHIGSGVVVSNTRRAAKMVILNADHPDIGDFIVCKADEERKAWALIDAGYPGGFNIPGGAYDSVAFQNANHSVRVTDAFMRAAENGMPWSTRAVTSGEPVETYNAKDLLMQIAESTHVCGDPGLQYDTTINDWHTCAGTDRIYASNPCSEFLFLDDTACLPWEARISTPRGLRAIGELYASQQAGEAVHVTTDLVSEHDHRRLASHRRAWVTHTGRKPVFKISLADGRRIRATGNHRFLSDTGEWKRVDELEVGVDRIALRQSGSTVAFDSHEEDVARWRMLGWMSGDGVFSRGATALVFGPHEEETACVMEGEFNRLIADAIAYKTALCPTQVLAGGALEEAGLPRGGCHISRQANGVLLISSKSQPLSKYLREWYGMREALATGKDAPSKVHHVADDLKVAYLQGLFSADGCIRRDARKGSEEVMLASSSPEMLRTVQLLLGDLGITSRMGWTHPTGRKNPQGQLHIYNQQARTFLSLVGFACSPKKQERAEEILSRAFEGALKNPRPARVISIEPDGVEDVFDITEPVTHSFLAEGLVTHNCNLASLNLMRFRDEVGAFETDTFIHACETFITAQEIIVSRASYPTEKIARNSEDYRPLGLGYANLGALLMAQGTAYDSDEGRSLAGAITAVMTGSAYAQSARIASNIGSFNGYSPNREPMLRVIRKHRDAVSGIRRGLVPPDLLDAAQRVWDQALVLGEKHGYRNAQASVLAPTGTIAFMMDCDTTGIEPDIALVKYKKLVGGGLLKIVNQTVPEALRRLGYSGEETRSIVDFIDKNDTIEGAPALRDDDLSVFDCAFKAMNGTRSIHYMGHIKMMAAAQPFLSGAISKCIVGKSLIFTAQGIRQIGDFYAGEKPGEFRACEETLASIGGNQRADLFYYGGVQPTIKLALADGRELEGTWNHRVKVANSAGYDWKRLDEIGLDDYVAVRLGANVWAREDAALGFEAGQPHGSQKPMRVPERMTPRLARLVGQHIAEGSISRSNWTVRLTNNNAQVLAGARETVREIFGLEGQIVSDARNGVTSLVVASKYLVEFLEHIGAGGKSDTKQIPWSILQSTQACLREFIGGLWLDGYVRGKDGMVAICLNSPTLLKQLQVVLNNFGLRAHIIRKHNAQYDKFFHELGMHGADARRFAELFTLDDEHKTQRLQVLTATAKKVSAVHSDVVPCFRDKIEAAIRQAKQTQHWRNALDPRTKHLSWHTARAAYEKFDIPELAEIITGDIHFVRVSEISEDVQPVYDFQVPGNHAFLGNAVVQHNTVNLPQDCIVEDIYNAYLESWKLGVKAVAIYRDGSKRTQPLSTSQDKKPGAIVAEAPKPYRRKLPDERASITHKFSIAGQEGYFMVGLFDDGSPGEIFIKMNKEGSTISGLMDSFAISISMALQYGVPLRVLVNKFTNTRFEPAGYTANRDIPIAKSLMDYIFRWFDMKFHPNGDNGSLVKAEPNLLESGDEGDSKKARGPEAPALRAAPASTSGASGSSNGSQARGGHAGDLTQGLIQAQTDAPPCSDCGSLMIRAGACYKCPDCGTTSGCG